MDGPPRIHKQAHALVMGGNEVGSEGGECAARLRQVNGKTEVRSRVRKARRRVANTAERVDSVDYLCQL